MNEAVLQAVEEHALTPEAIEGVIALSERDDVAEQRTRLKREGKDIEKRIAHLVAAIETGAEVTSLVAKLQELEKRRSAIDKETAGGATPATTTFDQEQSMGVGCGESSETKSEMSDSRTPLMEPRGGD